MKSSGPLRLMGALTAIVSLAGIQGCNESDANAAWTEVAKNCAVSDLNGKTILFFGPSNTIGPGSIWRQAPATAGGGYRVRYDSDSVPQTPKWAKDGAEFACDGNKKSKFTGAATANFSADLSPLSADAKADFSKAKSVEVKVSKMKWDLVLEGAFDEAVIRLPANNAVKQDLAKADRLVLYRALKVSGFEAKLSFDSGANADLQAKDLLKKVHGIQA